MFSEQKELKLKTKLGVPACRSSKTGLSFISHKWFNLDNKLTLIFPKGSPTTFKVRVINDEGKVKFDEVVKIDVAKKTETFHVPSREQSNEADVIHDFRKVNHYLFSSLVCSVFLPISLCFVHS